MLQLRYPDWKAFSFIKIGDDNSHMASGKRKKNKKSDYKKKKRKEARQSGEQNNQQNPQQHQA